MARTLTKPLVWLKGEVKTPPFSAEARVEAGFLLRRLQKGESLGLPHARPCHRLARDATNFGSTMRTKLGGLSTTLLPRRGHPRCVH